MLIGRQGRVAPPPHPVLVRNHRLYDRAQGFLDVVGHDAVGEVGGGIDAWDGHVQGVVLDLVEVAA